MSEAGSRFGVRERDAPEEGSPLAPRFATRGQAEPTRPPEEWRRRAAAAVSFFLTCQRAQAAGEQELAGKCLAGCHAVLHELIAAGCQLDAPMVQLYEQLNAAFGGRTAGE